DWDKVLFAALDQRLVVRLDQQTQPALSGADAEIRMPRPGTRWRYSYRNQSFPSGTRAFTIEIVGVDGTKIEERMLTESGDVSEQIVDGEALRFTSRTIAGTDTLVELAPYAPALYNRQAVEPSGYPSPLGDYWKIGRASFAAERVTVPGGQF